MVALEGARAAIRAWHPEVPAVVMVPDRPVLFTSLQVGFGKVPEPGRRVAMLTQIQ
jgi:hypothetical protein